MRQVVLDTETPGLEPALGHRVVEPGAVASVDRAHRADGLANASSDRLPAQSFPHGDAAHVEEDA